MYLAQNISFLRKKESLSQSDLGNQLGIKGNQVGRYEKGDSDPPVSKLIQLADIFDVSLQDLVMTDLSADSPRFPRPDQPYGSMNEDKKEAVFEELNQELRKRIKILEDYVVKQDPDQARRWGIIE